MAAFGWDRITRAWTSHEGSSGVVFVSLPSDTQDEQEKIFVIKSSSRIAEEIFANRLAEIVGLSVPKMRLVEYVNIEWLDIKESLNKFIVQSSEMGNDCTNVAQKLRSELDRPYFLIMDFVKGQPMECNYHLPTIFSSPSSRNLFVTSFGFMIAFDILINNSDRVPLVHNNEGNASNILITEQGECVAIDTCLSSIHPEVSKSLLERHLLKIESLYSALGPIVVGNLSEDMQQEVEKVAIKRLEVVRDFIWRATAYQISDEICLLIGKEIVNGMHQIVERLVGIADTDQPLDLRLVKENIAKYVTEDWENVWERSLQLVNLDYLEAALGAFQNCRRKENSPSGG